jgi:hypothetical protein
MVGKMHDLHEVPCHVKHSFKVWGKRSMELSQLLDYPSKVTVRSVLLRILAPKRSLIYNGPTWTAWPSAKQFCSGLIMFIFVKNLSYRHRVARRESAIVVMKLDLGKKENDHTEFREHKYKLDGDMIAANANMERHKKEFLCKLLMKVIVLNNLSKQSNIC